MGFSLILRNFSILSNFNLILKFFNNFVDYRCWFLNYIMRQDYIMDVISITELNHSFFYNIKPNNYSKLILINSFFDRYVFNYYISDNFVNNSKIMALCASKNKISSFTDYASNLRLILMYRCL